MRIITGFVFVILPMDVTHYKLIRESLYDNPQKRTLFLISSFTEQQPCYKPVYRVLVLRLFLDKSSKNKAKISLFCTINQARNSDWLTDLTTFWGTIVSPSINQRNCCCVNSWTSDSVLGHWNLPASNRLYKRRYPSFSQTSPLIRSVLRPQKRYMVSGSIGLSPKWLRTRVANQSQTANPYSRSRYKPV